MSISRYISLYSALNLPDPEGNGGDWHPDNILPENLNYAGEGCRVNTLPWLQNKGIIVYMDHESLPHYCGCRERWTSLSAPFTVANHQRAAVDLLYQDFVVRRGNGHSVDMYGWIDTEELIDAIFADFQDIVDQLSETPAQIRRADWQDYQDWVREMAA